MKSPSVSVFLPCYNQEEFIEESILSAVNQDYDNLTVVVGDDGSSDRTLEIAKELQVKYKERILIVPYNQHVGITANCQRILSYCSGEFIAFHAGDDIQLPGKIKAQVDWFQRNPDAVICGHDTIYFDNEGNKDLFLYSAKYYQMTEGKGVEYFNTTTCFYDALSIMARKSAIPDFGFDIRIPVCSDFKFWLDILKNGGRYGYVDGVYARHRLHLNNATKSPLKNVNELIAYKVILKDYPELKEVCEQNIYYLLKQMRHEVSHIETQKQGKKSAFKKIKSIVSNSLKGK